MIKRCKNTSCGNTPLGLTPAAIFQDREYGKGMRMMNPRGKKPPTGATHRCTVCNTVQ